MSLSQYNKEKFTQQSQKRGAAYLKSDYVNIIENHKNWVSGQVFNGRGGSYEVRLEKSGGELLTYCECPHYRSGAYCKHIWALLNLLDSSANIAFKSPKTPEIEHFYCDEELEWDAFNDDDFDTPIDYSPAKKPMHKSWSKTQKDSWEQDLNAVSQMLKRDLYSDKSNQIANITRQDNTAEIWCLLNFTETLNCGIPVIELKKRKLKKNGDWGRLQTHGISPHYSRSRPNPMDDKLYAIFQMNCMDPYDDHGFHYQSISPYNQSSIYLTNKDLMPTCLKMLCETGRFSWIDDQLDAKKSRSQNPKDISIPAPFQFRETEPWRLRIRVESDESKTNWILNGYLYRENEEISVTAPHLLLAAGFVFHGREIAPFQVNGNFPWIICFRQSSNIKVPMSEGSTLVKKLYSMQNLPDLQLPKELDWKPEVVIPKPILTILNLNLEGLPYHTAAVSFDYGVSKVSPGSGSPFIADAKQDKVITRDLQTEEAALRQLEDLGLRSVAGQFHDFEFPADNLEQVVQALNETGWLVQANNSKLRSTSINSKGFTAKISSGMDWFDFSAEMQVGDYAVEFPRLLEAAKNKQQYLTLADGSSAILPRGLLSKISPILRLGKEVGESIRFPKSQALILDALLDEKVTVAMDAEFKNLRTNLKSLKGISPCKEGKTFKGTLREYQRQGLGWLRFLHQFGLGGCLADDMGLGKTIQVLALLESLKGESIKEKMSPALIVVPRSLIHNWMQETRRFTDLTVLDYSLSNRKDLQKVFHEYDIILTTYGIMRSDILMLCEREFSFAILDEAQNIKNSGSLTAKAARLLKVERRLCMTGTPVENHVGELWSIFEFLNPGFMSNSSLAAISSSRDLDMKEDSLNMLAKAVSPFILRRTKEKVLKELPPKTEQTLYCVLRGEQKKHYDALKSHYRAQLANKIKKDGINKSQIMVLEALLRLRQASCHPGLIDPDQAKKKSAKLEVLMEHLPEIIENRHKVLIFSQFTSLLAILKPMLEKQGWEYEYLDGKTRNRQKKVEHFQQSDTCRIFLISLKAGGVGLNLTSADYCFILDPWWNPAAEAQAIDRTHRIGQVNPVTAYRIVAKGTVEEKVLELQKKKQRIADAIVSSNGSLMKNLTKQDLELLLS